MTREEIIQHFYSNGKILPQRTQEKYLKKHGYYDELIKYYDDSKSIRETLYRIYHNIDIRPVCKICGKPVTFNTFGYFSTYCSKACQNTDPDMLKKNSEGVSKALKNLYKLKGDEILEKRSNTLYKHFGEKVNTPFSIKSIQLKAYETIANKYNVNNIFQLSQYRQSRKDMQEKSIEYQKKRGYNIKYISDNPLTVKVYNGCNIHGDICMDWSLFNNRTRDERKDHMVLCPICNPIKNSETSIEKIIKNLLEKYNINYIQHDHKHIKPYELDFYLIDYNIGIECNGSYWHSGYNNFLKHTKKLEKCNANNIKLIYYWSYQIYNHIDDIEIDLCNQLNINNTNNYNNNIFKIKDDITYCFYSIKNKDNISNINTEFIAIPCDKDLLYKNTKYIITSAFPYFVDYRHECIIDNININSDNIDFLLENTVQNSGISICWTTNFNVYNVNDILKFLY